MNILFAAEYYFANPPLMHLSKELIKRKHNISVVTSRRTLDNEVIAGVDVFEVAPFVTIYKIPRAISLPILKLRRIMKEESIDIVHSPNDGSTNVISAALLARCARTPFIYTIQGPGTRTGSFLVDTLVTLYDYTIDRWLVNQARKIILLSRSLVSRTRKLRADESKIVVIPSGVDSEHFNPERSEVKVKASRIRQRLNIDDKIVIGYVGRLYPAKGLSYLLRAVKVIQESHSNVVVLVVGDGAQRNELEALARYLGLRVVFTGWQRDTAPYYSLMDIFVLPSMFEGLANVILEAMAMRKPVVATEVGGNPDLLSNGENGFLVPVCDVHQLASAMKKLASDENLRAHMGTTNRLKVEKQFVWSKTAEQVEQLYLEQTRLTRT